VRPVLRGLAVALLAWPASAAAQQGSIQVSGSAQALTGDPQRLGGQHRLEPDAGFSWRQPGSRLGLFQLELRGTRRQDRFHPGRMFVAVRQKKLRGVTWSFEGGDTHFSPAIGDYRFSNLFTPAVTFNGAAVTARTDRTTLVVAGGLTTAWRNIFGSDPQTLGQSIGSVRVTHRLVPRLELSARASRIRTSNLREFSYLVEASDQAGGGARWWIAPSLHLAGDVSAVSFKRIGSDTRERDVSALVGMHWLHRRGWLQLNASRFSAGDFPTLNTPLPDREAVFAAGDYALLARLRIFGGAEAFRANLDPAAAAAASRTIPESSGLREFGGVRLQLASRTSVAFRAETGARKSRPLHNGAGTDSDTGSWSADALVSTGRFMTSARVARRENVERVTGAGSYTQQDAMVQLFATIHRGAQVFGSALATRHELTEGGSTYWQAGGGAQLQVPRRQLWFRSELTLARNIDLLTQAYVPRESVSAGVNGQLTPNFMMAFNVHADRAPAMSATGSPWATRSTLRVTRTLATGSAYVTAPGMLGEAAPGRGTGTVVGSVFADWNGSGEFDPGDEMLPGIPVVLGAGNVATTGRDGQFTFLNVPTGPRQVGLDLAALPIDFDPPPEPRVDLHLSRGGTHRVAFPLTPLGTVVGRVFRDANGNGRLDDGDEPMDGAVIVLDGGARSERAREGRFRFDAVRSGPRTVRLLIESLPDGASISGDAERATALTRDRMIIEVDFLVAVEQRPEIRRVFPSRSGVPAAAATDTRSTPTATAKATPPGGTAKPPAPARAMAAAKPAPARPAARPAPASSATAPGRFVVQIAAYHNPATAADLLETLTRAGLPAYISHPGPSDPAPYRIRVGPFASQAAAQEMAHDLGRQRGEQLWVTRER
jgi:cell division septation protein DedD